MLFLNHAVEFINVLVVFHFKLTIFDDILENIFANFIKLYYVFLLMHEMYKICKGAIVASLLFGTFVFCACSHEDENVIQEDVVAAPVDPHFISEESALAALRKFEAQGSETRSLERQIERVEVLKRSALIPATRLTASVDEQPLAYVVNFLGGGYAVLGADVRQGVVIALVEKGCLSAETLVAAKAALDAQEGDVDLPTQVNGGMATYLVEALNRAYQPQLSEPETRWGIDMNAPLLKTEWSQWSPYNQHYQSQTGKNYPVGCVCLALTQMLIYNKNVHNIGPSVIDNSGYLTISKYYPNWSVLMEAITTPKPQGLCQYEVSRFLYEAGAVIRTSYTSKESKANLEDVVNYLKTIAGYKNVKLQPVNYDAIKAMIRYTPVMVRGLPQRIFDCDGFHIVMGANHAWLVDGYKQVIDLLPGWINGEYVTVQIVHELIHFRFGYRGELDGWYLYNDDLTNATDSEKMGTEEYNAYFMIYFTL